MTFPTEAEEQRALFRWAALASGAHPELRKLFHIPNEGRRSVVTGRRMKEEGMKSGVPDICLPVARGGYHALYIELKRVKGGRVTDAQRRWLYDLNVEGNRAVVCKGWNAAREEIENYLRGGV